MKKYLAKFGLLALAAAITSIALATTYYPLFGPATGILKGNASSPATTAAASSDVIALWSGTCSSSTFLRGDGTCAAGGGGGGVTSLSQGTGITLTPNPITSTGTITATGGGGTAVPGTIPDLIFWWESDNIVLSSGANVNKINDRTPWTPGVFATPGAGTPPTMDVAGLNSLNTVTFATSGSFTLNANYQYTISTSNVTIFAVWTTPSISGFGTLIGGAPHCLAYYGNNGSPHQQAIYNSGTASIATGTGTTTINTWYQTNVTYNSTSGAYAFRRARATDGSGTATTGVGTGLCEFIGADATATTNLWPGDIAVLIVYGRVLSGGEITSVENYINGKWGV